MTGHTHCAHRPYPMPSKEAPLIVTDGVSRSLENTGVYQGDRRDDTSKHTARDMIRHQGIVCRGLDGNILTEQHTVTRYPPHSNSQPRSLRFQHEIQKSPGRHGEGNALLSAVFPLALPGKLILRTVAERLAAAQAGARGVVHRDVKALGQLAHDELLARHLVREVVLGGPIKAENVDLRGSPRAAQHAQQACAQTTNDHICFAL